MAEETDPQTAVDEEQIEIDADVVDDLDNAMREAVEAVESVEARRAERASEPGELDITAAEVEAGPVSDDVAGLQAQIMDLREKALRTLAEYDNFRKRVQRERAEESRYGALPAMRDFVAIVDNLERALESEGPVQDLKQGVEMILKQMQRLFTDYGVQRVAAVGERFDPKVHEAVTRHEDPETMFPTVSAELQPGYMMSERLLRPALVRVAMPASTGDEAPDEVEGTDGEETSGEE